MSFTTVLSALVASSLVNTALAAVDPIVIKGSKFYYKSNDTQFFIKGVAYQQDYDGSTSSSSSNVTYVDPLADQSTCERDIKVLQAIDTNTIRVYAVDPTQNHDGCMNAFADAGIYVVADLAAPVDGQSIDTNDPNWNIQLYNRYTSVIDALAGYSNTLGFFAGNEVSNLANTTNAIAYVKAAVRDSKTYIQNKGYRSIGVGYACRDTDPYLDTAHYLACGDSSDSIDFFGFNVYSWCGDSNPTASSYSNFTTQFADYPVPAFFAEYGCNEVEPRTWGDTKYLYGSDMSQVWSGGIVYEYFPAANDFALVSIDGSTVTTNTDYTNLQSVIASVSPSATSKSAYSPTNTLPTCPTIGSTWLATSSPLPPTPNSDVCDCMVSSLSCTVKSSVASTDYSSLFGTVCGLNSNACQNITHNATTGTYGPYSGCGSQAQLSNAFDMYYEENGASSSACDFNGNAQVVQASSLSSACQASISSAENNASSTSSSSSSSSSSKSDAGEVAVKVNGVMIGLAVVAFVLL